MMASITPILADLVVIGAFITFLVALVRRVVLERVAATVR